MGCPKAGAGVAPPGVEKAPKPEVDPKAGLAGVAFAAPKALVCPNGVDEAAGWPKAEVVDAAAG